jgi:hypothetical protein
MNYQKIYDQLISKANDRILEGYSEKHHILPRSLGGSDDISNIIALTAREHFICHLLLAKIYGGRMYHAAHMMSNMKRYSSREYEWLKIKHAERISELLTGRIVSDKTRKMISENEERSQKISAALSGKTKSEEHIKNWVTSRKNGDNWYVSSEHKRKLSIAFSSEKNPMYGKTHSEEARKIISEANKKKVVCPHCNKEGGIAIMKRWHYDNCKHKP